MVCIVRNDKGLRSAYHPGMVTRIGPRKPRRNFLRAHREKVGLTQEQLADRIGTKKAQISNWENQNRAISPGAQEALEDALGIDPGQIYRDPERPSADELLRNASPELVQEAIDIIKVLVNRRAS